jgi:hypothetical protein
VRRPRPHQIVLAVGVLAALFTIASGLVPSLTHWHHDSTIERPVFIDVPTALKVAFYAAVATMLVVVGWLASLRVKNYERGLPDNRRTTRPRGGRHARVHLLRVHRPLHGDRRAGDRPPAAGVAEVPARPHL